jgi:hypothetical protein
MDVIKRPTLSRDLMALQVGCLLIGLAASLVPLLPRTYPFWGCNRSWSSLNPNEIQINEVLPASPASSVGLTDGDRVLAIDGQNIHSWETWDQMAQRMRPGQQIQLRVKRNGEELTLTAKGLEPQLEAVLYYDWQLAFAGSCVVFLILIVATQPLAPLPALWRPILLILAGLAGTATLLFYNWHGDVELLNRRWPVDNFPFPWIQFPICVAVAAGMAAFATWEVRRTVASCQRNVETEEKTSGNGSVKSIHVTESPRD